MSKRKPELKLVEDTGSELLAEELLPEPPPVQGEMPFALVEGQPMTELPRDLYIPPDALQVFLEAFEGPLDLLLYLIRKQNLDILDIPIAEITRQYMKYIEVMADLQLELAGEYLLMAAMLAEIKSRMLLPRPASTDGAEEDDPRAELVRRLQEYERFKKAAEDIDKLSRLERDTMPASAELQERKVVTLQPDVTLKEMLLAFKDVLSRAEKFAHHHISRERLSQRERMSEILSRLQTQAFFEFTQLFRPEEGRMGVTVTFIAILELMKEGLIEIVQAEPYAPIHVRTAQRHLKVVAGNAAAAASVTADAENEAALSQPELDGENDVEEEVETTPDTPQPEDAAVEGALAEAAAIGAALGVDEVVIGDAPPADSLAAAAADDLSVTTPSAEGLSAEVVEPVVVADTAHEHVSEVSVAEFPDQEPVVVSIDAAGIESQQPLAGETSEALAVESPELLSDAASDVLTAAETQAQIGGETAEHAADESQELGTTQAIATVAADTQSQFSDETSEILAADESQAQIASETSEDAADEARELGAAEAIESDSADSQGRFSDETSDVFAAGELQDKAASEPLQHVTDESQELGVAETAQTNAADLRGQFSDETSAVLVPDETLSQVANETLEHAADDSQESGAAEAVDVAEAAAQDEFDGETSDAIAADESLEAGTAKTVEDVAADEVSAVETQTLATTESDEHATAASDNDGETSAISELDEQPTAHSATDAQSFAGAEPDEKVAVDAKPEAAEPAAIESAVADFDERTAAVSDTQTLAAPEPAQHAADDVAIDQDVPALAQPGEQVAFKAEQDAAEPAATGSDEQTIAASGTQAYAASQPDQPAVAETTTDHGTSAGVEQDAEEVALRAEKVSPRRHPTGSEGQFVSALDERAHQSPESSGLIPAPEELAAKTLAAIQETSGDSQASVVLGTGEALVEEHVVEEHVVPEHVVKENVVRQETSDIAGELSASDDSVTESSSEADNSDAEPSR